jgi:hypothetical protein
MLVTLDLTARQAARVLTQALHTHAKLEIEPRPESCNALLWGSVAGQEQDLLQVDLYDSGREVALSALIGAMCDVRTILSGQLCIFSTFIADASATTVPPRILLAMPETIQVANRRRFARKTATEPVPVRLIVPAVHTPLVAVLANIGATGIGCRLVDPTQDDPLFIGDEIQVEFVLPWSDEVFSLPASVCAKTRCREEGHILVGLEFIASPEPPALDHLRAALNERTTYLTETDGEL